MKPEILRDTAELIGYNQFDDIVYSVRISLYDYYDGEHPWDSNEGVMKLKMVRMSGQLFDLHGKLIQEFETNFSPENGTNIGGWIKHEDGTEQRDGICAN